jgi:hypothetical protein
MVERSDTTGYKLGCLQHPKAIKARIGFSGWQSPAD